MSAASQPSHRRALLAKVHLGAKQLGLDDDTRRDLLARVTGHRSSGDCRDDQLVAVIKEYRRLGWTPHAVAGRAAPSPTRRVKAAAHPVAVKARALWISLHQLGVVRDPSERALEAFAARQLKVDRLVWADQSQGYRLIEGLKAMAERAGWSQDLSMIKAERAVWTLKTRLVNAQLAKLKRGYLQGPQTEAYLDKAAKDLGREINAQRAEETSAA